MLYCYLFCNSQENGQKKSAFTFQTINIMATIHSHENVQCEMNGKHKKTQGDVDLIDEELFTRLKVLF
jgi:hypothetical protein